MHAVGLHSALAIKRQRKRRDEQRRARERRYSSQSAESGFTSPRASTASLDHHHSRHHRKPNAKSFSTQGMVDSKVVTSIGMLHIGVVFLVLGAFLLVSGLLPSDLTKSWNTKVPGRWWNELVAIGLFSVSVGLFLIILNRVIAKKEEDDLEKYVQHQLTRSRSGHRLEKDLETGGLTTKHAKRAKQLKKKEQSNENDLSIAENRKKSSPRSPPPDNLSFSAQSGHHSAIQSPLLLGQISEEDIISDKIDSLMKKDPSPNIETNSFYKSTCNMNDTCRVQQLHHPLCVEISKI